MKLCYFSFTVLFADVFNSAFCSCPTGLLNRVLSWQGFLVTTRLSYALSLTQLPVFFYFVGKNRDIHTFNKWLFVSVE
jgi:hypothetical protein